MLRTERLTHPSEEEHRAIIAPLDAFSRDAGFEWSPRAVVLALRRDDGQIVGGLTGTLNFGWLRIDILAVSSPYRGQGWGRRLVLEAERIAAEADCHAAWVDTFTFQAPSFYEKLDYVRFGELHAYPEGHSRIFFQKRLR